MSILEASWAPSWLKAVCANGIVGISQGHDVLPEFYAILALVAAIMAVL